MKRLLSYSLFAFGLLLVGHGLLRVPHDLPFWRGYIGAFCMCLCGVTIARAVRLW